MLDLNKRVRDLEKLAPKKEEPPPTSREELELSWEALEARWAARKAEVVRRKSLPLEEQLELEESDLAETRARAPAEFNELYTRVHESFGVRSVEIAILGRDGRIDAETSRKLNENAWAHVRFGTPLTPLPGSPGAQRQEQRHAKHIA